MNWRQWFNLLHGYIYWILLVHVRVSTTGHGSLSTARLLCLCVWVQVMEM